MKLKIFIIILISFGLFWFGCDKLDPVDTDGPDVTIIFPANNDTVWELIPVEAASPNYDVTKVELWISQLKPDSLIELEMSIDSLLAFIDSLENNFELSNYFQILDNNLIGIDNDGPPYIIDWNTTILVDEGNPYYPDSSINYLTAKAFDSNNNYKISDGIFVVVDNSLAVPSSVYIQSIEFIDGGLLINWSISNDTDFLFYFIEKSIYPDSLMNVSSIVDTIYEKNQNSYFDTQINPLEIQYYRVAVVDTFNFVTTSEIDTSVPDPFPNEVDVISVEYDLEEMNIKWELNNDTDFKKYRLYYSETEEGDTNFVAEYLQQEDDTHIISFPNFDPTKQNWYFIEVVDTLLQSIIGSGATNDLDSPPDTSNILSINFFANAFDIEWEQSTESDFQMYYLYESYNSDMSNGEIIDSSQVITDTFHQVAGVGVGEQRFYQVVVKDIWGLSTVSEISIADANYWFTMNFGGEDLDQAHTVLHTSDGGFVLGGETSSSILIDGISYNDVSTDIWIVKIDSLRNIEFQYYNDNPSQPDQCFSIISTSDGGYLITGEIGELFGTVLNVGLIKLDQYGAEEWQTNPCDFCGSNKSYGKSAIQTSDGGYLLTGYTDYGDSHALWIIKTNNVGIEQWHFLSSDLDGMDAQGYDIIEDSFGDVISVGWKREEENNTKDVWVGKFNSSGQIIWIKQFDLNGYEVGSAIELGTFGYTIGGYVSDLENTEKDMLLIEIDQNGELVWNKQYGGGNDELANGLSTTIDNGYILVGKTTSYGSGAEDIYVVKTDGYGNVNWEQYYGGIYEDVGEDIQKTFEGQGGFIISGSTYSPENNWDYWLIKTNSLGETAPY